MTVISEDIHVVGAFRGLTARCYFNSCGKFENKKAFAPVLAVFVGSFDYERETSDTASFTLHSTIFNCTEAPVYTVVEPAVALAASSSYTAYVSIMAMREVIECGL